MLPEILPTSRPYAHTHWAKEKKKKKKIYIYIYIGQPTLLILKLSICPSFVDPNYVSLSFLLNLPTPITVISSFF